jgi:hypothetical protein
MQELYDKVSQELYDAANSYFNDEISLEDFEKIQEREILVLNHSNWTERKTKLKESIFNLTKQLYNDINACEQKIRIFKSISSSKEFEIDEEAIISQAKYLSRNRAPPAGFENSNWYLGPYPTVQMIEALNESTEEHQK